MRIEMMVTTAQLPRNGLTLIQQEMERRVLKVYPDAKIRIRKGTNNQLEIFCHKDDKKPANRLIGEMFNEAEEWLHV
ncbi:DinI-like family protein [Vibrio sp. OPT18]|uniref:DinI-like family protein n=1 Tax=Vibrio sp. OPT18 TaxID=2778641 RepID=UPI00187E78E1|nr:DinI-like family protein [Vibrio sp. OPT18]MBE8574082.1 DinI-like family protein [Vibrio sp. OPT18]